MCRLRANFANFLFFVARNCFSLVFFFLLTVRSQEPEEQLNYLVAVAGQRVNIPCNMTPPVNGDSNTLALWYKDDHETPFYTVDNRTDGDDLEPQHRFTDNVVNRAYFNMVYSPPRLQIDDVRESDGGIYRCRVDFVKSRTVNYLTKLTVIVPPETPVIRNENDNALVGLIGPYNEEDSLFLVCEVRKGKPRPTVKWWRGPNLIEGKFTITSGGIVRNDLIILKLNRNHYKMNLTCSASNNNITQPPSTTVQIDMNFKPRSVKITTNKKKPLSTRKPNEIVCKSTGSLPAAEMTWWKGTKKMKSTKYFVTKNNDGTMTATSILRFIPSSRDNGVFLTCRARNPQIDGSALEDGYRLLVHYKPEMVLTMDPSVDGNAVQEGQSLFLSCSIRAHPIVRNVLWYFNGEPLEERDGNIVISNDSLHLQRVTKSNSGDYSCRASNFQGQGISNAITLRVKFAPVCKENQTFIYGISKHEDAHVICQVEADPPYVKFRWTFNNSNEQFKIIEFKSDGLTSRTKYTPRSPNDYGYLFCWATNKIGVQKKPCIYSLVFASSPDEPFNCLVLNRTWSMLEVECAPGYDGGLSTTYFMEVYDQHTREIYVNVTSDDVPHFVANDLPAGQQLLVKIFSFNSKGRSDPTTLSTNTAKFTQSQTGTDTPKKESFIFNPIIAILMGIVASLVIIAIIIIISMRIISVKQRNRHIKNNADQVKTHIPFQTTIIDQDFQQYEMKDPDIIPARNSVNDSGFEEFADERRRKNKELPYEILPHSTKNMAHNNSSNGASRNIKKGDEVAYAELSLPQKNAAKDAIRRQEMPTEYATIDFHKKSHLSPGHSSVASQDSSDTSVNTPLMNNKLESTV